MKFKEAEPSLIARIDEEEPSLIAGIDEAGRGCLAGPVVAAAVILSSEHDIQGLVDSKVIKAPRREFLAEQIKKYALAWSVGVVWPREIEKINILQATFQAMAKASSSLKYRPELLLIDGNKVLPAVVLQKYFTKNMPKQQCIIKGDAKIESISAASIIAKTFRDCIMLKLHKRYSIYGFDKHKGYGTKAHLQSLRENGHCVQHRLTFAGVLSPSQTVKNSQGFLW